MGDVVILSAVRTAIADARRSPLAQLPVQELAKVPVLEAIARAGVAASDIDDLVLGEVMQGGGDIARYVAVDVGLTGIPGLAVQRHCASGLQALASAAADIRSGMTRVAVAGGVESMTNTPVTLMRSTTPPVGGNRVLISRSHPETPDAPAMNMGITVGENTAAEAGISRERQDEWAYHSHMRAIAAIDDGRFAQEIIAVEVPNGRGEVAVFDTDQHPRRDTSLEKLAALRAVFKDGGTVTAGNSSSLNDGAAALVLADEAYASQHGLAPLATIRGWAAVGVEPARTGLAPTEAIPKALDRAGVAIHDVTLVEINEAFASMAVACSEKLGFSHDMVNVNGGAVGLGHPVACSGARIVVTLIHELRRRGGGYGVASLCAGGGMGMAMVLEVAGSVTPADYLEHIRRDSARLADVARMGLDAPVPACPGWTVADLVSHTGEVQRQKALIVARRIQVHPREAFGEFAAELPGLELDPPAAADLVEWFEAGSAILIEALSNADPAEKVWTWYEPQQDVAFWHRRMAHEAVIHRVDAEQAHGARTPIPADLAADGVDEALDWNLRYDLDGESVVAGSGQTIHLHAHDAPGEWMLTIHPDRIDLERGHGKGDTAIRGSAEALDLYLWGRGSLDDLEVIGDPALAVRLRELAALATQ